MTFAEGDSKVVMIGNPQIIGYNLDVLRESGRYIMESGSGFIAKSEKKTRTYAVSGSITSDQGGQFFFEYEETPNQQEYETAQMFPQDLINDYAVEELLLYGVLWLLNMELSQEPGDSQAWLKRAELSSWITRQPSTTFAWEDSLSTKFVAKSRGELGSYTEDGVAIDTVKKKRVPVFTPIKSYLPVRRKGDKIYLYTDLTAVGYCLNSTTGGNVVGSLTLETRLIMGLGYLPEEVEELLYAKQ